MAVSKNAMTPLERLANFSHRKQLTLVGLMSGTSADGVDACLVTFTRQGGGHQPISAVNWQLEAFKYFPFKKSLRKKILQVAGPQGSVEEACHLDIELGQEYGKAVKTLIEKAWAGCADHENAGDGKGRTRSNSPVTIDDIVAVASHGQTIRHIPPRGQRLGGTTQIGQAAIIAQVTGLPVISDFRVADMAAGGQGAPLVPAADRLLFAHGQKTVAIQNVGGMGNITVIPPRGSTSPVQAFDTGPGNALLDLAMAHYSKGRHHCDFGGKRAARGLCISPLLKWLLKHPFLEKKPPKSTGREVFGEALFQKILARPEVKDAKADDVIRTLTEFTTASIAQAMQFVETPDIFYVAGGGAKNETLMAELAKRLPMQVEPLGDLVDCREALCFAALGFLFLLGWPGAEPAVTGASEAAILGKLSLPPQWVIKN